MLGVLVAAYGDVVLPASAEPHERLEQAEFQGFEGAIGALDGTHVPVYVEGVNPTPWRNRKGYLS